MPFVEPTSSRVRRNPTNVPVTSDMNSVYILPPYLFKIHFSNVLHLSKHKNNQTSWSVNSFVTKDYVCKAGTSSQYLEIL